MTNTTSLRAETQTASDLSLPELASNGDALTVVESTTLAEHEATIERGLKTFYEVGAALCAICVGRLYRDLHGSFDDYCKDRWVMGAAYAYRLIDAAKLRDDLSPIGDTLPANEAQARALASVAEKERAEVWQEVVETAPKDDEGDPIITAKHVQAVVERDQKKTANGTRTRHQLGTSTAEWYTPTEYVERARCVMGSIDFDPASCEFAQKTVKAGCYLDAGRHWVGNVFLNPPYGAPLMSRFVVKLCDEFEAGNIDQAVLLTNDCVDTVWSQMAMRECAVACQVSGRIKFYGENGTANSPTNGQTFFYFGDRRDEFVREFSDVGVCVEQVRLGNAEADR